MRDRFETLPDQPAHEDQFDDFWAETTERWGVDAARAEEIKAAAQEKLLKKNNPSLEEEADWVSERPTVPQLELPPDMPADAQKTSDGKGTSDSPEIIINEITTDLKSELLYLLIEETVARIRNFDFESITVAPGKEHLTAAIAKTVMSVCDDDDLLLIIDVQSDKFTIIKKDRVDYNGRMMDEKKTYIFHALLKNFSHAVTIK